ncbi:hypothetical protein ACFQ0M_18485 [Kitasatospora aburaviensis]
MTAMFDQELREQLARARKELAAARAEGTPTASRPTRAGSPD